MYVKYIKNDVDEYEHSAASDAKMNNLGSFLVRDCRYDAQAFKSCVLDDECEAFGSDAIYIEKEGDLLILSYDFSEQLDGGPYFKIPQNEFLHLLDIWEKVYAQKPQEITIIYDEQGFSIEMERR